MSAADIPALFETMRAENSHIARLDLHLDRLDASAKAFGIPFDRFGINFEQLQLGEGVRRVQLTLFPDGQVTLETGPHPRAPFQTVWICPDRMPEAGGPFCTHKTTHREHYETRWHSAQERGVDEAIILNPRGEIVEGTRTTVWVKHEDQLWTPPLSSGGLPGVERAHLLATRPDSGERVLLPGDLDLADAVFLSNALRGLMQVELVDGDVGGEGE